MKTETIKPTNQREAIDKHLKDFSSITPLHALKYYGCMRLSHIIYVLRKEGMKIETINTQSISKFGYKCNYATYQLKLES